MANQFKDIYSLFILFWKPQNHDKIHLEAVERCKELYLGFCQSSIRAENRQ